jgi:hypothetical protein
MQVLRKSLLVYAEALVSFQEFGAVYITETHPDLGRIKNDVMRFLMVFLKKKNVSIFFFSFNMKQCYLLKKIYIKKWIPLENSL